MGRPSSYDPRARVRAFPPTQSRARGLNKNQGEMALKSKDQKSKMPPAPSVEKDSTKKKKKKSRPSYASYIFKVLKQVHPKLRISKMAMAVMESCVEDTFERIATEANKLCRLSKKDTLTSREIQSATRLVLPGELAKHAVGEGSKACLKYKNGKE